MSNSFAESKNKYEQSDSDVTFYFSEPTLPEDTNPLDFWKLNQARFPHLSMLAEHYLSILASSAPVEQLFSIAEKIFRPDRCSMSDETFQKLITIKCNAHIYNLINTHAHLINVIVK